MRPFPRSVPVVAVAVLSMLAAPAALAQPRADSLFARARQLVSDGNGAAGRALVDSILGGSPEGSPLHGESLYWRAALSESGTGAQHDYLRVTIEYPNSPRAGDALLRLAQLELARGDREGALRHLERLTRDYPESPLLARAHLWRARTLLDGAVPAAGPACASIAQARTRAAANDAELRNQIEFYGRRCAGVDTTTPRPRTSPPPGRADSSSSRSASGRFSVQVAAYGTRVDAAALATRLKQRGMRARVVSAGAIHRVWVGSHATRTEATAAMQELKRARIEGFVVEVP